MAYFTKNEARTAAKSRVYREAFAKSYSQVLNEERNAVGNSESFNVFLSHSINDAELVIGVKRLLEAQGLKVYVDWEMDGHLDRTAVTPATADLLRKRMKQSESLIYLATESSPKSKWMPWELGYFDGLKSGMVAVMPLLDDANSIFTGQEYLGLYPKIEKGYYSDTSQPETFIKRSDMWTTLKQFGRGSTGLWYQYGR